MNLSSEMTAGADLTLQDAGTSGQFIDTAISGANSLTLGAGQDTVVFGDELTNDVVLNSFTDGIGGDVLDLSGLGVSGFSDLTFSQFENTATDPTTATDDSVQITSSEFDGEIYLAGVLTSDLDATNFNFA